MRGSWIHKLTLMPVMRNEKTSAIFGNLTIASREEQCESSVPSPADPGFPTYRSDKRLETQKWLYPFTPPRTEWITVNMLFRRVFLST